MTRFDMVIEYDADEPYIECYDDDKYGPLLWVDEVLPWLKKCQQTINYLNRCANNERRNPLDVRLDSLIEELSDDR